MIACIGWGSLAWDPKELPVASTWRTDGPLLPVEFARQSNDGRLTLVLTPTAFLAPTLWVPLEVADMNAAVEALRIREGRTRRQWIGRWSGAASEGDSITELISEWGQAVGLDGVVWTALPPKFNGEEGRVPTVLEAIDYLDSLKGTTRVWAEEYVRRTPPQVRTRYRITIEERLGWSPR